MQTPFKLALLVAMVFFVVSFQLAEAKRLGGGKSFGSRPSYSQSQRSPDSANRASNNRQANAPAQNNRRGLLGGLLGGLLMGSLLGALFFGGGFSGFGFADILLIILVGVAIWFVFKMLRQRAAPTTATTPQHHSFRDTPQNTGSTGGLFGGYANQQTAAPFDEAGFLQTAKDLYTQLQIAWDADDLNQLRRMTTDKVFAELQTQRAERQGITKTEITTVEARLVEVKHIGGESVASVLFDVEMRELPETSFKHVHEIFHFVQSGQDWLLEGIQQVEDGNY